MGASTLLLVFHLVTDLRTSFFLLMASLSSSPITSEIFRGDSCDDRKSSNVTHSESKAAVVNGKLPVSG
uniref:Secreted protein n=1 Tax=Steinernema glaseri TaxID=37863 RepID=A0A1I8A9Y7_9BILA